MVVQWDLSDPCMVLYLHLFVTTDLLRKTACVSLCFCTDAIFILFKCMSDTVLTHMLEWHHLFHHQLC